MVSWYWLIAAAIIGGSCGCFGMAVLVASGNSGDGEPTEA